MNAPDSPRSNRFAMHSRHNRRPRTLLLLLALAAFSLGGLSAHAQQETTAGDGPAPQALPGQPHVDIFRGLGGYMPGVECWQERLAARGISSTVWHDCACHRVARRIVERRAQGDTSPIVLMAYATGGGSTRHVALDLAQHGICVDAIILLEPSFFEPVPRNVRFCFAAYKPEPLQMWNSLMRGNPVRVEACAATIARRVNLKEIAPCGVLRGENHLTITANAWVQELLVGQAAAAFGLDVAHRQETTDD